MVNLQAICHVCRCIFIRVFHRLVIVTDHVAAPTTDVTRRSAKIMVSFILLTYYFCSRMYLRRITHTRERTHAPIHPPNLTHTDSDIRAFLWPYFTVRINLNTRENPTCLTRWSQTSRVQTPMIEPRTAGEGSGQTGQLICIFSGSFRKKNWLIIN